MRTVIFLPVLVLFATAAASAEGKTAACKGEVERLCKGVEPGQGRILKCMREHEAELPEACRAAIGKAKEGVREKMQEKKAEYEEACKADADSEKCQAFKAKMQEKREKMKAVKGASEACLADKERLCKDVKPGEGRIMECLKAHEAELSEACRAAKANKHGKAEKKEKPEPKKG
ncbi:MAG: hypothetical protein FD126_1411 [Elusimicrobia bacterium]|nr:MAG: hypothetical protein FD126_1411 [Elusimicrobiota bacterium]